MAYRFSRDEDLTRGVRRVARDQIEKALTQLDELDGEGVEDAVHDVRKRCKKVRGVVRLVRPELGKEYQRANTLARAAARELSSIRDAHALLATFDDLVAAHADQLPAGRLTGVRTGLRARADAATATVTGDDERIARARRLLAGLRDRTEKWSAPDEADVIRGGLAKTYGRGRDGWAASQEDPSDERLHEWRKRVKYLWYHTRLLAPAAPSVLGPAAKRLHDLSDSLGDDHDLAVLTRLLRAEPEAFGGEAEVATRSCCWRVVAPTCSAARCCSARASTPRGRKPSRGESPRTGRSGGSWGRSCRPARSPTWRTRPTAWRSSPASSCTSAPRRSTCRAAQAWTATACWRRCAPPELSGR